MASFICFHRFGSLRKEATALDPFKDKEAMATNDVTDEERIYYEPPVDMENSRRRKVGTVDPMDTAFITEDSVYENCDVEHGFITFENAKEDVYEPIKETLDNKEPDSVKPASDGWGSGNSTGDTTDSQTQNMDTDQCPSYPDVVEQGCEHIQGVADDVSANTANTQFFIDSLFSKEDLDGDHLYVNGNVNNNPSNYYVTPKYSYGQQQNVMVVQGSSDHVKKESIYDVPK